MRVKIIAAALMTTMLLGSMPTKAEELQLADSVNYGLGQKPEITVEVLDEGIKKPVKKNTKGLKSSENTSLPKNYDSRVCYTGKDSGEIRNVLGFYDNCRRREQYAAPGLCGFGRDRLFGAAFGVYCT